MAKIEYSKYQIKIFNEWKNTSNSLAIEARPGSGKSFMLLEILKLIPPFKKSIFLAFNKSIQMELSAKVPERTDCFTLHSIGYRTLLKNTNQKYKLNEIKNWILGKKILKLNIKDPKKQSVYLFTISKLVDIYRLNMCTGASDLAVAADKFNITVFNGEIDHAMELINYLQSYNSKHHENMLIDFIDMIYLPVTLLKFEDFPKYDVVMCDEVQDTNPMQWVLIQKLFKKRTRFCAVGDPFQSIYSFMGADKDVFNQIKNYPNTTTLPLSYSYRCAKTIAQEANKVFNFIESPDSMEEGEVIQDGNLSEVKTGDFILCRNNLPLIEVFLNLLKAKKKAHIMGKDYGKGLLTILNKIEDFTSKSVNKLLNDKEEKLKDKGLKNPKNNQGYLDLEEKLTILKVLHGSFPSLNNLKNTIEEMFNDNKQSNAIILSSIHKSKGLDSDNVYIIGFKELIPSQYAETPLELYQEECLKYVSITRARKKLVFVPLNRIEIPIPILSINKPNREKHRNRHWEDR